MDNLKFIGSIFIIFILSLICIIGLCLVLSGKLRNWLRKKIHDIFHFILGKINRKTSTKTSTKYEPSTYYIPSYKHQPTTTSQPTYSLNDYELKYDYKDVFLAFSNNYDCSGLMVNDSCVLTSEPSNSYDPKAVAVYCRDKKIGYIKKGKLQDMYYDFVERNEKVTATISKIENTDIFLRLCFYKKIDVLEELEDKHQTKCCKLTGNKNAEMQEALMLSSVGEEVYYSWNFEKEKFESDIGFFPKSVNQYLENNAPVYIYDIDEDEDGKYFVTVIVQID